VLLPDNVHPEQTIYYYGGFVLKAVNDSPGTSVLELYTHTSIDHKLSMPNFLLSLDWLFLLGLVVLNKNGRVEACT
jgi:hypothetical protein